MDNNNMDFDESFMYAENFGGPVQVEQQEGSPPVVANKCGRKTGKNSGNKVDVQAKIERNRQSAKDCRARKKIRYEYLEELVADRERAVLALRRELEKYHRWCVEIDAGRTPEGLSELVEEMSAIERKYKSMFPSVD